jgi:hypothetical protein
MQVTMCDNARRSFVETIVDVAIEKCDLPEGARDEAIEAYLSQLPATHDLEVEGL